MLRQTWRNAPSASERQQLIPTGDVLPEAWRTLPPELVAELLFGFGVGIADAFEECDTEPRWEEWVEREYDRGPAGQPCISGPDRHNRMQPISDRTMFDRAALWLWATTYASYFTGMTGNRIRDAIAHLHGIDRTLAHTHFISEHALTTLSANPTDITGFLASRTQYLEEQEIEFIRQIGLDIDV